MSTSNWVLYGANGFTARLIIELALSRGHKPVLAGRSAQRVEPLARKYNLPWRAVALNDKKALESLLADAHTVLHCAGPFIHTWRPMAEACLATGCNYLDITGEIPVFLGLYGLDAQAKAKGIALIPGVGFDVVPSDCLARFTAEALPGATQLEIALNALSRISAGTAKTMLEMLPNANGGSLVEGKFTHAPIGNKQDRVAFAHKEKYIASVVIADQASAPRSTGIRNITTYAALHPKQVKTARNWAPLLGKLLTIDFIRKLAQGIAAHSAKGPDAEMQRDSKSYLWARATHPNGQQVEATLVTMEAYRLTAECGVRAVEKLIENPLAGAFAPAQAFGSGFILEVPGSEMQVSKRKN